MHTIGCCDSGIGGMLIVDALHKAYPNLDIVFIADQKNVPYGDKTTEQIKGFARGIFEAFRKMNIQDVVGACNTLCVSLDDEIIEEYSDLKIYKIVEPTCKQLINHDYKKIGILATAKTIDTHAYSNELKKTNPNAEVYEIAAPKFVPIIENGCDPILLEEAVKEYTNIEVDSWILGCTHYPLIIPYLNGNYDIYDSRQAVVDLFKDRNMEGTGKITVYTSGDPIQMKQSLQQLLHLDLDVKSIEL